MITREEFLALHVVSFPKHEDVLLPNGKSVKVKKLKAGERDKFEVSNAEASRADFRARLVVACLINDDGAQVFDYEDIPKITEFDVDILDPIVTAALRVNGFTEKEQEELRKNSNGQAPNS